ncbi:hypothetical protein JCM10213_000843 [Rhodosporidiobolus nylandii]
MVRSRRLPSSDESSDATSSRDDSASHSSRSSRSSDSSGSDRDQKAATAYHPRHHQKKRRRKLAAAPPQQNNNTIIILLIGLILLALAAAAFFYFRSGSTEDLDATSATTGSSAGGGSTGAGGSAGAAGETAKETGGTKTSTAPSSKPASSSSATAQPAAGSSGESATSASATEKGDASSNASAPAAATASLKCKKGVGYNEAKFTKNLDSLCWAFNWASSGQGELNDGVMYVPQLWGPDHVGDWDANAKAAIAAGASAVLGMNEPDLPEQANMAPAAAAELWKSVIEPLAGSAKLVAASTTNGVKLDNGTSMGVPWLKEFLGNCSDCTVDAIGLHWYDSAGNTAYFTSYLENAHDELKKPIWLTEFMGIGTPEEQATFVKFAVDYLEKQDWIEAYAAFGDFADNAVAEFVNDDASLNDLGKAYNEAN